MQIRWKLAIHSIRPSQAEVKRYSNQGVSRAGPPTICPAPDEGEIKISITGNHEATMLVSSYFFLKFSDIVPYFGFQTVRALMVEKRDEVSVEPNFGTFFCHPVFLHNLLIPDA